MKTYRIVVKQIDEHTFAQAEVPKNVVDEIRADAIEEFVDSVITEIGLLKKRADDEWVDYALDYIKRFVISKAER